MRNLILILIISSFFACNQRNEKIENRIKRFEQILGTKETNYLNEIINDFNKYLNSKYHSGGLVSKYEKYLIELSENKLTDIWKINSANLIKFHRTSNLFAKYDSIYPDSVWYEKGMFESKYKGFELTEFVIPLTNKNEINLDSMIIDLQNEPRLRLIEPSRFFLALDSVKKGDSLIINYLDAIEVVGNLHPSILTKGLLLDFDRKSQYFSKRILVMEMNN